MPDIAFGDLGHSSLAEVVAAGFRAIATGTIAVEQGRGESRLFMRYGAPAGTQLFVDHKPFSFFLVENGHLEPSDSERFLAESAKSGQRLGEVLVAHGVLSPEHVIELVTQHHRECLLSLCLLREGKYELRGWERPPDWTEPIALDPLQTLVSSMAADELFDRRRDILDRIGDTKLRLADDFGDLASRLVLSPQDHSALMRLRTPRSVLEFAATLRRDDAEAFVAATALLGLTDGAHGTQVAVPSDLIQPADVDVDIDASSFLTPVEPTIAPASAAALLRPLEEESIVFEDAATLLTPLPETRPPFRGARASRPSQWSDEMSAKLDDALAAAAPAYARTETLTAYDQLGDVPLDDVGFAPPEIHEPTPSSAPSRTPARIREGDEFEFDASADEEPLELDLQRAPAALRESMDRHATITRPTKTVPPARPTPPPRPSIAPPARSTPPPRPPVASSVKTPSRPVSTLTAKPPSPADEYNPFSVHFRRAAALAPSSIEELEARLEKALREGTLHDIEAPVAPPVAPRDTLTFGAPLTARQASRQSAPSGAASILTDIETLVADFEPEPMTGPITLEAPQPARNAVDDDGLALLAAEEAARESSMLDLDGLSTVVDDGDFESPSADEEQIVEDDVLVHEEPVAEEAPGPAGGGYADAFEILTPPEEEPEPSGQDIRLTPAPDEEPPAPTPEKTPTPLTMSSDRPTDVRRRLLQRAFMNVAGTVMTQTTGRHNVRAPDSIAPRPENADTNLEQDLQARLAALPKQDHFARLDLPRTAETDAIKEAFLNLAKRYHPDRLSAMGQPHLLPQGRELFARVKESYDVLVDPASRARYLSELNNKDGNRTKLSPEEAKAAFLRGTHYLRKRDFKNAEAEFIRAIDADPQPEYLAELAWTLLSNPTQRDSAKVEIRDLMQRALKSGKESDRAYVVAAHIARAEGDHDKTERYFRKAMEQNPKNIEAARELRLIEMRRGSEKKTSSFLDKLRSKPAAPK